jgi:hypothetical protein
MRHRCRYCGKHFATRPRYETHACVEEVNAVVQTLEADGIVESDGQMVRLTAQGRALAAARRKAREAGLDPDVVAPV